ncbi:MAG: hypothetical protein WCO55_00875 [Candidatus Falkowbacteria bacterium]
MKRLLLVCCLGLWLVATVAWAKPVDCSCERTFRQAYPIVWRGQVIASFVGGDDYGLKLWHKVGSYQAFYLLGQGKLKLQLGQQVVIKGRLMGMTCAYANTIFKSCVPEVQID